MGGVAGQSRQETKQVDQRRGRHGRGRTISSGHRLRHHAGSGWKNPNCDPSALTPRNAWVLVRHSYNNPFPPYSCETESDLTPGEAVKQHSETGTHAGSGATRDCSWASGRQPSLVRLFIISFWNRHQSPLYLWASILLHQVGKISYSGEAGAAADESFSTSTGISLHPDLPHHTIRPISFLDGTINHVLGSEEGLFGGCLPSDWRVPAWPPFTFS